MNNKCIMVRCIFPFEDRKVLDKLHAALESVVRQRWPNACVSIEHCSDYWKVEGDKDVAFGITNYSSITVRDFIDLLKIEWDYAETVLSISARNYYESAIWSQLCSPEEVFLLPIVEWVNVFTWIE